MQRTLNDTSILHIIRSIFTSICIGMKIETWRITRAARRARLPPEEYAPESLESLDIIGKGLLAFNIMISVADAILNVYNIVKTVERYKKNIEIFAKARQQYKDFYQHLYDASVQYNEKLGN
uniref:Uncharacterized protein n=1 Tax=Amphimedon queenslandica TaxID=400682 RepID=A0A1X7SLL2_AMPQE